MYSYTVKILRKIDDLTICWHFQKIFASRCDKLFIFSDKNQKVCKSVNTSVKDPGYQFLSTATQSKFFQKFDNSAVCWPFLKIFASQCDKLFIFSDKNQNVCKSVTTVRKDSGYQFLFKVTHLKFSNVQEIWQLHCQLTFSDNFCIRESHFVCLVRQKSKAVQKCSNKPEEPRVPVVF